jgi:hypothetical protein
MHLSTADKSLSRRLADLVIRHRTGKRPVHELPNGSYVDLSDHISPAPAVVSPSLSTAAGVSLSSLPTPTRQEAAR